MINFIINSLPKDNYTTLRISSPNHDNTQEDESKIKIEKDDFYSYSIRSIDKIASNIFGILDELQSLPNLSLCKEDDTKFLFQEDLEEKFQENLEETIDSIKNYSLNIIEEMSDLTDSKDGSSDPTDRFLDVAEQLKQKGIRMLEEARDIPGLIGHSCQREDCVQKKYDEIFNSTLLLISQAYKIKEHILEQRNLSSINLEISQIPDDKYSIVSLKSGEVTYKNYQNDIPNEIIFKSMPEEEETKSLNENLDVPGRFIVSLESRKKQMFEFLNVLNELKFIDVKSSSHQVQYITSTLNFIDFFRNNSQEFNKFDVALDSNYCYNNSTIVTDFNEILRVTRQNDSSEIEYERIQNFERFLDVMKFDLINRIDFIDDIFPSLFSFPTDPNNNLIIDKTYFDTTCENASLNLLDFLTNLYISFNNMEDLISNSISPIDDAIAIPTPEMDSRKRFELLTTLELSPFRFGDTINHFQIFLLQNFNATLEELRNLHVIKPDRYLNGRWNCQITFRNQNLTRELLLPEGPQEEAISRAETEAFQKMKFKKEFFNTFLHNDFAQIISNCSPHFKRIYSVKSVDGNTIYECLVKFKDKDLEVGSGSTMAKAHINAYSKIGVSLTLAIETLTIDEALEISERLENKTALDS